VIVRKGLSPATRFAVWRRDGFRCTYCGVTAEEPGVVLEVDHIIAVLHGGSDDFANLTTACKPCNFRKGPRRPKSTRVRVKTPRRANGARVTKPNTAWAPDPSYRARLRNRVRVARLEQRLTQEELASKAGITRATIIKIERDDGYEPSGEVMTKLSVAIDDTRTFWIERYHVAVEAAL
jgi:DNA-binding XRE family transcriptional regulator